MEMGIWAVAVARVVEGPMRVEVEVTRGLARIRVIGTKTRPMSRVVILTPTPPLQNLKSNTR